jgi:6-pyruvoyltetrahydropterin/6-carboxytetrahydropterin synthase
VPTTENVASEIWRRLELPLARAAARLHRVRLYETEDLYVDCFGDRS